MSASYDVDPATLGRLSCASLTVDDEGRDVELSGWVNRRRDLGGLIFIDLRDRFGVTQIIFTPRSRRRRTQSPVQYAMSLSCEWQAQSAAALQKPSILDS